LITLHLKVFKLSFQHFLTNQEIAKQTQNYIKTFYSIIIFLV